MNAVQLHTASSISARAAARWLTLRPCIVFNSPIIARSSSRTVTSYDTATEQCFLPRFIRSFINADDRFGKRTVGSYRLLSSTFAE